MAEIIKLAKYRRALSKAAAVKGKAKPPKPRKHERGRKWHAFTTQTVAMPLVAELMRDTVPPTSQGPNAILEFGVLAFRREGNGEPLVLLISKRPANRWGIPKG